MLSVTSYPVTLATTLVDLRDADTRGHVRRADDCHWLSVADRGAGRGALLLNVSTFFLCNNIETVAQKKTDQQIKGAETSGKLWVEIG